ncbi:adenosine deaminase [Streptomyces californicus]|uniref:adenosine deaminase n=1 Tax=Streptomyces californicus TaxID=67351 RepID=A0ABD7CRG5_9ACTN|nr:MULTISPECIES: adenosine deaminase [Streptomyces]QRV31556.1 adenosine deaminase [Streptomyces californicus]QRV32834.1 adenosine deaminase [Streptomyces californicus]QRV44973.1 adenosine deaminase [Streptomyces californicus]QRV51662.1 adenosine deaminase [Streptomyces californicus]
MISSIRTAHRPSSLLPAGLGLLALVALLPAAPASATPVREPSPRAGAQAPARFTTPAERRTDERLDGLRSDPARLKEFFADLPKGGDLHNHLSGAVTTEYLIQLAGENGLCIDATDTAVRPPCGPGARPAADARTDTAFRQRVVRAWSMQDFPAGQSGHDHFFDTFGKFGEATRDRGKMLANVADTVVEQNQFYLETLVTPASDAAKKLADAVGYDADPAALHRKLTAGGKLDKVVAEAVREADAADAQFRETARCDSDRPAPGCRLPVRWISQVSRGSSNERVFTQMAVGMRLAERDPRFVAVNLVQPEDGESALRNYRLQMRMLQYLRTQYPDARLTLHAGELTPGLVKPEDLTFHIREAVLVAGAERIGHGVDLVHEDDWQRLARTMARRGVAVEVPFSSNKQILGVAGDDHPFEAYRRHGVPVVLATDDPGVSRIDISHEYQYARATYGLSYPELKDLARASLTYAFLDGGSLWAGGADRSGHHPVRACAGSRPGVAKPAPACARYLADNAKAAAEWRQEAAFAGFERRYGGGR